MTPEHTTTAPLIALGDELYVELVGGHHLRRHTVSFPALVDEHRRRGMWAQPRFRREVAEALAEWLNLVYPHDPDWYPLAHFDGDTLVIQRGESERHCSAIAPDDDGRYGLGPDGGCWFLSTPTLTAPAQLREIGLLWDNRLRITTDGEVLISCDPGGTLGGGFPARIEPLGRSGQVVPTFRRDVAEAVAAWCTSRHRNDPDHHPQAYFDGDTLVHVHQHRRVLDGYTPWRITPTASGCYRIDRAEEWAFHLAADTAPAVETSAAASHG